MVSVPAARCDCGPLADHLADLKFAEFTNGHGPRIKLSASAVIAAAVRTVMYRTTFNRKTGTEERQVDEEVVEHQATPPSDDPRPCPSARRGIP